MSTQRTGLNSRVTLLMFLLGFLMSWSALSYGEVPSIPAISAIIHQEIGLCLDMTGYSRASERLLRGHRCEASGDRRDQSPVLRHKRGGYQMKTWRGQKCLDVSKSTWVTGAQARRCSYHAHAHQMLDLRAHKSGELMMIRWLDRGQCLYMDSGDRQLRLAHCHSSR